MPSQLAAGCQNGPDGVVTLSLIDFNLPTTADFGTRGFADLACRSIVHLGRISLYVTTPTGRRLICRMSAFDFAQPPIVPKFIEQ